MRPLRLALLCLLASCDSSNPPPVQAPQPLTCVDEDPAAVIDVTGTFRYVGDRPPYWLRGTIVFEQTGDVVRVLDTTYDNAFDRALEGQATLVGNRLDITLVPRNGDPDYEADLTFLFGAGGDRFCVSFSDTNLDVGPMGSYRGERQ